MKRFFKIAVLAGIAVAAAFAAARAEERQFTPLIPERIVLDGKTYAQKEILNAFLYAALSRYDGKVPDIEKFQQEKPKSIIAKPDLFQKKYPWLYEYLYRRKSVPARSIVYKWRKPVLISLGFPNDLKPDAVPEEKPSFLQPDLFWGSVIDEPSVTAADAGWWAGQKAYEHAGRPRSEIKHWATDVIRDEVGKQLQAISEITGLPVSFLPHNEESASRRANIRMIISNKKLEEINGYKYGVNAPKEKGKRGVIDVEMDGASSSASSTGFRKEVEPLLASAVPYTPSVSSQVDGFFLPEEDGSIGMAFCYFPSDPSEALLRALVRECLVRSLGLPESVPQDEAVLGLWGGRGKTPGLSDLDRFMLGLLYSPQIKSGDTALSVSHLVKG